jgi:hypothetical protein
VYYSNQWRAQDFPFLSQELFNGSASNSSVYVTYNQSIILNDQFEIDHAAVDREGAPWMTATYVAYLITTNMGMTSTLVYMLLWNWDDLKSAWSWCSLTTLKKAVNPRELLSLAKETRNKGCDGKRPTPMKVSVLLGSRSREIVLKFTAVDTLLVGLTFSHVVHVHLHPLLWYDIPMNTSHVRCI